MTQILNQGKDALPRSTVQSLAQVLIQSLARLLTRVLVIIVRFYQLVFSSVMPGTCRFTPTCSCYAVDALKNHGIIHGSYLTIKRLLRCNPWGSWGHDPVPPAR